MKEISDEELLNSVLANQIPEAPNHSEVVEEVSEAVESVPDTIESKVPSNPLAGKKLSFIPGDRSSFISDEDKEASRKFDEMAHVSRTGENIFQNAELREGWIPVNRELMGTRSYFYPQDWEFRIRPATVEAIRNWSNVDENNIVGDGTIKAINYLLGKWGYQQKGIAGAKFIKRLRAEIEKKI